MVLTLSIIGGCLVGVGNSLLKTSRPEVYAGRRHIRRRWRTAGWALMGSGIGLLAIATALAWLQTRG